MAKMTVEVPAERFDEAVKVVFNKNKNRFTVPGFRKGKAPLAMVENFYGASIFYEDAANDVVDEAYPEAAKESGLDIVSRPSIEVIQIGKGQPMVFTAEVAVKPPVTLGEYKGVEVERASEEVSDEDVENELKKEQDQNSRLISVDDRPVQDGDTVTIDYDGYIDGEPFEGGKAEDYRLIIGSHTFVGDFEEQLIGKNIGDEFDVNVTFPDDYHAADLAGKDAVFKVKIKEIRYKELPELDDEFASEVSEFETLDEYKDDIRAKLKETRAREAATENENRVVDKVVSNAQINIPEPMIEAQEEDLVNEYARQMQSQGLPFNDYLRYTGMTVDDMKEQMRPQAEQRIRTRLTLEAVAAAENIEVSDEEVEAELQKMADSYEMELDKVKEMMGEDQIKMLKEDLAVQDAIDLLVAEAKLV